MLFSVKATAHLEFSRSNGRDFRNFKFLTAGAVKRVVNSGISIHSYLCNVVFFCALL